METTINNRNTALFNKVPEVTFFFWIIKVLCTTVGETFADFLNVNLNFGLTGTSVVMGILLLLALFFQMRTKKYVPVVYWITVVFISVFGTLVTDILTDKLGVPLETSTIVFSVLLLLSFALWYVKEKTLSIHSIYTMRREFFYWLTVLFTFALGTAAGDLMAESLGLGYLVTGIIVAVIIVIVIIARQLKLNAVLSFWIIYIMTRPLGASIGDLLSQPTKYGGLGLGATLTSVLFLAGIFAIILYFSFTKKDISERAVTETADDTGRGLIWQTVITVAVFVIVGITSYYWRHASLQKEVPAAAATSVKGATSKPSSETNKPLGDLLIFTTIAADTRQMVTANKMDAAKTRVADLEHEWDQAQGRLKPMNGAKWTEVDDAIDKVLRQLRGVNPTQQGSAAALDALLQVLR